MPPSYLSKFIIVCCVLFSFGCSLTEPKKESVSSCDDSLFSSTVIKGRFGSVNIVENHQNDIYFARWCEQLIGKCKVKVIRSDEPVALSTPSGEIYISTKMLELTTKESELLFVIAHEAGHLYLKHFDGSCGINYSTQREEEADSYAIYTLYKKGYEITSLPAFIRKIENQVNLSPEERGTLEARALAIEVMPIMSSATSNSTYRPESEGFLNLRY